MISSDWPLVGDYLDFKDRNGIWRAGLVLVKTDMHLKIRLDGFCQRFDEVIAIPEDIHALKNARIQPFRTVVRGYTGQKKTISQR